MGIDFYVWVDVVDIFGYILKVLVYFFFLMMFSFYLGVYFLIIVFLLEER